ncbi:hypothetical protein GOHSU_57_00090 [Gordonia hirsuta DSM 44140 = NBRC 16056]|uniref:EccD-like transmembrane domain-containing protein n=1 Tax=Gordonia hirsuta DSM 44140 = NBRC 16056 TaxID=1121927 RepID=L7LDQ9_9ACTN|nr:type VII secretion integral membrane protein EccD [Gordonia hirsuta]GAC58891.1 hypothetical protein GOHSU_57_00090 [Gordonia hirsuta DSM 44140 = NBRC 16056]
MTITAQPELLRISILGAETQVDVALPAEAPIIALMPDLLALLRIPPPPVDDAERIGELPRWTLGRIGQTPLAADSSLAAAEVHDGELLLVCPDRPTTAGAVIDDVVDGLAHLTHKRHPAWAAADARRLGRAVCLAAALVAALAGRLAGDQQPLLIAAVSGGTALLLLAAAALNNRLVGDPANSTTLSVAAFIFAVLAGSLVPQPNSTGPALAAAGACGVAAAVIAHRCTGLAHSLHAALATIAALLGITGLATMGLSGDLRAAAAVTAATGVYTMLLSARMAIAAGRLPLPPVPNTPPPVPVLDTDDGIEGLEATRLDAIADLALVDLDDLDRRTRAASGYLTGIVVGTAATTAVAVLLVAVGFAGSRVSLLFCGAVAVALLARGRTHADRTQSATLLSSGAACLLAVLVGSGSAVLTFFGGLVLAATALLVGTTSESHDRSPLQRRSLEIAEYAVIVGIVPLLLWLLDVYRTIREF